MAWRTEYLKDKPKPIKGSKIHCFTCKSDVTSKAKVARDHKGHDVDYVPDPMTQEPWSPY